MSTDTAAAAEASGTAVEELVLRPRDDMFDRRLVEPKPAQEWAESGLVLHSNVANGALTYAASQVLMDASDPTRALARTNRPIMTPLAEMELEGQVTNVVFVQELIDWGEKPCNTSEWLIRA